MREQGEGIPRMFEEMQVSFLPMPEIDVDGGWFRVVLRNQPIFQTTDPDWSRAVRELSILVSQKLDVLARRMNSVGFITNADYREAFGVDRHAAKQALARWTASHVLVLESGRDEVAAVMNGL